MEKTENDKKPSDDEKGLHKFSSPWHFSDVVLVVEGTHFHVHRSILSMWSPVFEKMFTSEFSEKNAQEIPLPGKRADEVEQLFEMIYSSDAKHEVTETNYEFLLEFAREYQMDKVQQYCTRYMERHIDKQNCLHRYKVAERYELKDVMGKCNEEACFKSSTDLEESADFRELGFESKFKLCMARMKKLEKALTQYDDICAKMVSRFYKIVSADMPKDLMSQCDNIESHSYQSYREGKGIDSSCNLCRKTMDRYQRKKSGVKSSSDTASYYYAQLNNVIFDNEVEKIRKQMKRF